ncbi:MAG: tRNA (adenosine(37)-N6)-threonylcarbamoyltransferase complex ATPase subunit type 1 TsaE [Chloroflexi bacterium]|nr:tRNA (adenosine(37)-N6)-threonylcarbamoyltransferase complex ATPase subunit type 1 TsaE [Chloroflexota bacterium]
MPALSLRLTTRSPEETQELGSRLGALLRGGEVILLLGDLGTGKTTFVQGLARGLGVKEYTKSPSFVLVNEYQGRVPLYHIDFYRIEGGAEAWDLGLEDYVQGPGVCAIEWAERGMSALPPERMIVRLRRISEDQREITLEPHGTRYERLVAELRETGR